MFKNIQYLSKNNTSYLGDCWSDYLFTFLLTTTISILLYSTQFSIYIDDNIKSYQLTQIANICNENASCYDTEVLKLFNVNRSNTTIFKLQTIFKCFKNSNNVTVVYGSVIDSNVNGYFISNTTHLTETIIVIDNLATASTYYHEVCHYTQYIENRSFNEGECYYAGFNARKNNLKFPELQEISCSNYKYLAN